MQNKRRVGPIKSQDVLIDPKLKLKKAMGTMMLKGKKKNV